MVLDQIKDVNDIKKLNEEKLIFTNKRKITLL